MTDNRGAVSVLSADPNGYSPMGLRQAGLRPSRRSTSVLVVDGWGSNLGAARQALETGDFEVEGAPDAGAAVAAVRRRAPDVVLIDLAMPGIGGLDALARLRAMSTVPVVVLGGLGDDSEHLLVLQLGADDYVARPFAKDELSARIGCVLRRCRTDPSYGTLVFGRLEIRVAEREVVLDGVVVEMTRRELDLLVTLASSPRRAFSRAELLNTVWGSSSDWQDPATVTEHVRRLRRKIESDPDRPRWVQTVRGVGYRFEPQDL